MTHDEYWKHVKCETEQHVAALFRDTRTKICAASTTTATT